MSNMQTNEQQRQQVTSRLLANAIAQRIMDTRIGLRADALPTFAPRLFYDELLRLLPANTIRVGLLGFESILDESEWLTHSAETAVGWRNDPEHGEKLVIILNPAQEQQKVHSLHMLEPFSDEIFYKAICEQGIANATAPLIEQLWKFLSNQRTKRIFSLVSEQVITLYAELEAGTTTSVALAALHLLPDNDIATNQNSIDKRLNQNKDLVAWLDELDKAGMRVLARALVKDQTDEISRTFGLIKQYRANRSADNLAKLSLHSIEQIKATPKPKPQPSPNAFKRGSASQALVNDLLSLPYITDETETDHLLEAFEAQAELAAALFRDEVAENYEADLERTENETGASATELGATETIISRNSAEESEYVYPKDKDEHHPLHDYVREWVHYTVWGGVLTIDNLIDEHANLRNALQNDQVLRTFTPHPIDELRDLLTEIDKLVLQPPDPAPALTPLFDALKEQRDRLINDRWLFLYYPIDATFTPDLKAAIPAYLESYEAFTNALQKASRKIRSTNPESVELVNARFLAFDTVIVELNYGSRTVYNAILTPLHPLHLWKWYKLKGLFLSNNIPLRDVEHKTVSSAIQSLPTLLNTFMLHERMFTENRPLADEHLVLAGELRNERRDDVIGVPYYAPAAHSLESPDGIKAFTNYLEAFLIVYPPARLGLTIVVVDPPQFTPILEALGKLHAANAEGERRLYGASVFVYQRSEQQPAHEDWGDRIAPTLQLFREHPQWQLQTHRKIGNYQEALRTKIPHITLICDPSDTIVVSIDRRMEQVATPFGVPEQVTYDSITDTAKREPFPNGDLFNSYTGVRHLLSGETVSTVHAIGRKVNKTDLQTLLNDNGTRWLAILDQAYGTAQIEKLGQPLLAQRVGGRTLTIHTGEEQWRTYWYTKLHDELQRIDIPIKLDTAELLQRIGELFPILENGLLQLIRQSNDESHYHRPFDMTVLSELLGVIATLNWYRRTHLGAVMIRLDEAFKDWEGWKKGSADYLAFWFEDNHLYVDVVTLHTQVKNSTLPALHEARECLEQKAGLAHTLITLYEQQDGLITPLRQSLVHHRLYDIVFAATSRSPLQQTKETKRAWAQALNKLFSAEMQPTIQLVHVAVGLYESSLKRLQTQTLDRGSSRFAWKSVQLPVTFLIQTDPAGPEQVTMPVEDSVETKPVSITSNPAETIFEAETAAVDELNAVVAPPQKINGSTEEPSLQDIEEVPHEIIQQADELRSVLVAYGIAIAEVNTEHTQIGARFVRYWVRLQPPAGRVSDLQKYANDIARELGTISVPLIGNIPGKRFVGVDLPRAEPETIYLRDALDQLPQEQPFELMVTIGQNVAGEMIMHDLSRLPHMLVAGHTGGGKSVFLASLISSLIWRHSAETLRLILVDPKLMDFPVFETLSHLHEGQVIYDPVAAIEILRWLIEEESDRRARLMRETGHRKIESYYRHYPKSSLPRIVVIIDEFADIMNSLERRERQDFERQINRLAATGRARGIHLVLATQRPTVDVVSGNIKANIPARVSFQLTTQTDSRTILDQAGAEALLGQGDMLFSADNQTERLQGYFATDEELEQIVELRS